MPRKAALVLAGGLDGNAREMTRRLFNRLFVDVQRRVGRLRAGQLVRRSLVLATVIASPAAAVPSFAEPSNVSGAHATQGSDPVGLFIPRVFHSPDPPSRRALAPDVMEASSGPKVGEERGVADANPAREQRRHHVGYQIGVFNPSTNVIELGSLGFGVPRSDGLAIISYRFSLNTRMDLVAEVRYWTSRGPTATSGEAKISGGFMGPGIRVHASKGRRVVPYLQGNVYYVQEMLYVEEMLGDEKLLYEHGIGFGLSGGVDLEVTRLISLPMEATYVGHRRGRFDDLSGFGVTAGINFNF